MPDRNCIRCQKDFYALDRTRVCPECISSRKPTPLNPKLSPRERQVVALVAEGKFNKEVAWALHLNTGTIKVYVSRIFQKLGVTNRTELAIWALKHQQQQQSEPQ